MATSELGLQEEQLAEGSNLKIIVRCSFAKGI
jgi:hypothetical protein